MGALFTPAYLYLSFFFFFDWQTEIRLIRSEIRETFQKVLWLIQP